MSFAATYFDGTDLRGRSVEVEILPDGALTVRGELISKTIPVRDFAFSQSLGQIPRFAYLPGGTILEVPFTVASERELSCLVPKPGLLSTVIRKLEARIVPTTVAVVIAVATVVAIATTAIPRLARRIAFAVPESVETEIGRTSVAALYQYSNGSNLDWYAESRVQSQLDRLTRARSLHIQPHLLFFNLGQPNAFALPGGPVIVTDQLVNLGLTDDEIAAVLAHEMGHEELRHGMQNILSQSTALIVVSIVTGDLSTLTHFSGILPALLLTRGYSRDFERQADAFAVGLLADARIDPEALARALEKIQKASGSQGAPSGAYLSTHPSTPERIRVIRQLGEKAFAPVRSLLEAQSAALLTTACESYRKKDFRTAVADFRSAFEVEPPNDVALYNAACAAALAGYPKASEYWLTSAVLKGRLNLAVLPTDPALDSIRRGDDWNSMVSLGNRVARSFATAYKARGQAEYARGDFVAAVYDFHREIAAESKPFEDLALKGATDAKEGRYAAAIADFDRAIAIRPDDLLVYKFRGFAKLQVDPAAAIADLDRYIAKVPDDAESLLFRARVKTVSGQLKSAIADFDLSIRLNPNEAHAYYERGLAKDIIGDFTGALGDYQTAAQIHLEGDDHAAYNHYRIFLILRRLHRGGGEREIEIATAPPKAAWTQEVGRFLSGETTEAAFFQQASKGDSKTANEHKCEACYYAGEIRLLRHEPDQARSLLRDCLATGVTDYDEYALARGELARMPAR